MKKYWFGLIALVLITSSCTNLEEKLYDGIPEELFPENGDQVANIGIGAYDPLKELADYGGWWFCQEMTTDEMVGPTRGKDWDDNGKWRTLQLHTWDNETEAVVGMWERYYRGIAECNKTLEVQFNNDTVNADATVKNTMAKFIALRSYYYWLLIDNYGDVPYVTSYSQADPAPYKNTRAFVFDNIVKDLTWAITQLKRSEVRYSVSKGMAQMTLAKLYMNAGVYTGTTKYAEAKAILEDLKANGGYTLAAKVSDPFIEQNDACPENIFTAYYSGEENAKGKPEFNLHMRTLGYQSNKTFNSLAGPWNGFATLEAHFNSYATNDLRRSSYFLFGAQKTFDGKSLVDPEVQEPWNFTPAIPALKMTEAAYSKKQIRHSGARVIKYQIAANSGQGLANDIVFLRLTDAYLMLAEIYAIENNSAKVKEYLDPIRTRAGLSALATYDLDAVKLERKLEMFYEGTRRQDMIRWGIFNTAWNCAWKADINTANNNLFPIPKKQTDANPNLLAPAVN